MTRPSYPAPAQWRAATESSLLDSLRLTSREFLQSCLVRILDAVEQGLLERDRNATQRFDPAPREDLCKLRIARIPILRDSLGLLDQGFDRLDGQASTTSHARRTLSLVGDEQLAGLVACDLLADALLQNHGWELDALAKRLAVLVGQDPLPQAQNPLSAPSLAQMLCRAASLGELPEAVRSTVLAAYDRELQAGLGDFLAGVNATLVQAGLLPHLRPRPSRSTTQPSVRRDSLPPPPPPAPAIAAAATREDHELFDALRDLLRSFRDERTAPTPIAPDQPPLRALRRDEVVARLSQMQSTPTAGLHAALAERTTAMADQIKRELLRPGTDLAVEDADAIELAGMVFDALVDEHDFDAEARAQLSRLAVATAKAAVLDRELFQSRNHPARRLLNALAEALHGDGASANSVKSLREHAVAAIDRLLLEFHFDAAIFAELEAQLREGLDRQRRRAELAERRLAEAQRGQERLEQARALSRSTLTARVGTRRLPDAMQEFLDQACTHHLCMLALRDGVDGEAWQAALVAIEGLIGMLQRDAGGEAICAAPEALAQLEPGIAGILASSGIGGQCVTTHLQRLGDAIAEAWQVADAALFDAVEAAEQREAAAMPPAPVYDEADCQALRALKLGSWVDLVGDDARRQTIKLSWISPISQRLMFVDRRGTRVLVASIEELAVLMKQERLLLRTTDQLFDRAMQRVLDRLQQA